MTEIVAPSTEQILLEEDPDEPKRDTSFWPYLLKKLGGAALSMLMVIVLGFFLFRLLPGDPVAKIARDKPMSPEQLAQLREQYGLDKPMWEQFFDYIVNIVTFNFGESYVYRRPVADLIAEYFWPTILLTGTSALIAIAIGLFLGTRAGWKRGSWFDRIASGSALLFWSVPTFWLALLLMMIFAGQLKWFPTAGMTQFNSHQPAPNFFVGAVDVLGHLVLPVLTMVAVIYAQYLMVMRSSIIEEKTQDYLTTARAKGLPDDLVRSKHAVPNALLPTVTLVFMHIGGLIGGAVTVETVFSWPGLGKLTFEALKGPDAPLLQGTFVVFSAIVIVMNFIADLVYRRLDPRVRRA